MSRGRHSKTTQEGNLLRMRLILSIVLIMLSAALQSVAAKAHLEVDSVSVSRDKDSVQVSMVLNLNNLELNNSDLIWLTPRLINQNDSVDLPTICVYGRNPYYSYVRTGPYSNYADMQLRGKRAPASLDYIQNVPFQQWMEQASLVIISSQTNSCGDIKTATYTKVYEAPPYEIVSRPEMVESVTSHTLGGRAHIDFVLDKTDIRPDYHSNADELAKIRAQIDSVINDTSAILQSMTIHGYASPEGPYNHNVYLARERTQSLKRYINELYSFPDDFIQTDYTPEDWENFRRVVEESDLPHKSQILEIIDLDMEPDAKLRRIKNQYNSEYRVILSQCFPYLRHSDYTIGYVRREYKQRIVGHDTINKMPNSQLLPTTPLTQFKNFTPFFALKTNLLFDIASAINIEAEVPFGKEKLWSVMVEWWTPWYVWHSNSRAFEFQTLGIELRRWFRSCRKGLPPLSGPFAGVYYNNGKYDLEWNSEGDQGEFNSVGATVGYSFVLHKYFNLELSLSAGVFWGPRRHYIGMFNDTHLIWQYNANTTYVGPTKAKISLVWLIGKGKSNKRKGGAYE